MYPDKQTELFDTIFKVFPNASIVRKSKLNPFEQPQNKNDGNRTLAKRTKPRQAVLLACKRKGFNNRQLSFFDEIERGGI
jgi:hypothetical protein